MSTPIAFRASATKPCPVCGTGSKSCSSTADGLHLCRGEPLVGWARITKSPDTAGFHHYRRIDDSRRPAGNAKSGSTSAPARNWQAEAERFARDLTDEKRQQLASALGLPVACLAAFPLLGFICDPNGGACWTFTEHGPDGGITGINRRFVADGTKRMIQDGTRGVYLPADWRSRPGPILVPEGASDVLALSVVGLTAIGRPNDKGGADTLAALLGDDTRELIVVGENDKKENGHWPGREGAEFVAKKLAALLARPVKWSLPPDGIKDARAWVSKLASASSGSCEWGTFGRPILEHLQTVAQTAPPLVALYKPESQAELVVTSLVGKKVKPVRYLIPGRVPAGKLILCGARGGSGKSTLWRAIAAALSTGRCALGLTYPDPVRAKVLIFAAEDGVEDVILPGLLAEGADLSRVAIVEGVRHGKTKSDFMLSPEHVDLLRQRLRQDSDTKLILIDPIASFVGRAKVDDHRAAELRLVLDPLSELAESTGVTVVMIAHLNKSTGDAVDRFAGSAAYRDSVRAAFLITEDSEDESRRLLMPVKENLSGFDRTTIPFSLVPLPAYDADVLLKRDEFRGLDAGDLAAVRGQLRRVQFDVPRSVNPDEAMKAKKADGTKVERCKEWLRTLLAKFAFPSKEITDAGKAAGFTFDNLKEAKSQLKVEGAISHSPERFPGGWWSGTGAPSTWVARPEPLPTTPQCSPLPTPPLSSPIREREESSGELGTSGEWGAEGGSTHQPPHLPAPGTSEAL